MFFPPTSRVTALYRAWFGGERNGNLVEHLSTVCQEFSYIRYFFEGQGTWGVAVMRWSGPEGGQDSEGWHGVF